MVINNVHKPKVFILCIYYYFFYQKIYQVYVYEYLAYLQIQVKSKSKPHSHYFMPNKLNLRKQSQDRSVHELYPLKFSFEEASFEHFGSEQPFNNNRLLNIICIFDFTLLCVFTHITIVCFIGWLCWPCSGTLAIYFFNTFSF